jgi:hypothetical protein
MYAGNRSELTKIVEAIKASGERQISLRLTQPLDDDDEAFKPVQWINADVLAAEKGLSLKKHLSVDDHRLTTFRLRENRTRQCFFDDEPS